MSSGTIPGAWAPSTSVSIPRSANARTIRSIGKTSAVGLVTWLTRARRVRGVTAASSASTISSSLLTGSGIRATTTRAPAGSATARRALIVALYS